MQSTTNASDSTLMVACLCASWCGTCDSYRPLFRQLQSQFPSILLHWVDIEDESDLVDPMEVENFPTVLIAKGENPLFFGTLLPHIETLQRLITSCIGGQAPTAPTVQGVDALLRRLQSFHREKGLQRP